MPITAWTLSFADSIRKILRIGTDWQMRLYGVPIWHQTNDMADNAALWRIALRMALQSTLQLDLADSS